MSCRSSVAPGSGDALEWFTGTTIPGRYGKFHYECTRCELNAFSSDELAEFIETGLQRHGATTKLVPPAEVLAANARTIRDEALTELVTEELAGMVDIDALVRQLIADHPDLGRRRRNTRARHVHQPHPPGRGGR